MDSAVGRRWTLALNFRAISMTPATCQGLTTHPAAVKATTYPVRDGTTRATTDVIMRSISLHLPESGNGTPDLLNEARWNIDWMLTMQDSDGGVWHKQTSDHFCGFIAPQKDTLPSLVIGVGSAPFKTSCATADFAAVTAIAARVFIPYDRS